jgi:hypothetical protein
VPVPGLCEANWERAVLDGQARMACGGEVALRAVRRRAIPYGLRSEAEERRGPILFRASGLRRCAGEGHRIRVAEKAETNLGSAGWTARATLRHHSFSKRLLCGLVVIACSRLGFEMGLVHLDLYGVILVGTIGGRGREGEDVVGTCVTNAACDAVGYVVGGGQGAHGNSPKLTHGAGGQDSSPL